MNERANVLADRLLAGVQELVELTADLTEDEWQTRIPNEERSTNVLVHHVASMYPIEVELAQSLASGKAIVGVTYPVVDQMNAEHAQAYADVSPQEAIELLQTNSQAAADAIRQFSDDDLERAAPVSLSYDAPLTAQFFIEDHALRHSFQHIASIRTALDR